MSEDLHVPIQAVLADDLAKMLSSGDLAEVWRRGLADAWDAGYEEGESMNPGARDWSPELNPYRKGEK